MQQDLTLLLKPLSPNAVGENLHYDPVYDQIRDARRADNPKLSRGVWEIQLKQSDWGEVERLCTDALTQRTKDFQIAAWLAESWGMLESITGLARGFDFLEQFIGVFGQTMYPLVVGDDQEHLLRICDWMDEAFSRVLIMIPLTQSDIEMNFADFMSATRLDTIVRRSTSPDRILANAVASKDPTLTDFNAQITMTDIDFFKDCQESLNLFHANFDRFRIAIDRCTKGQSPSFKTIIARSQEMSRLISNTIEERLQKKQEIQKVKEQEEMNPAAQVQPEVAAPKKPQTLNELYEQLDLLATSFTELDPNGPIPNILRRLVQWEGKTLPDILQEYSKTPEQMAALVKLMSRE